MNLQVGDVMLINRGPMRHIEVQQNDPCSGQSNTIEFPPIEDTKWRGVVFRVVKVGMPGPGGQSMKVDGGFGEHTCIAEGLNSIVRGQRFIIDPNDVDLWPVDTGTLEAMGLEVPKMVMGMPWGRRKSDRPWRGASIAFMAISLLTFITLEAVLYRASMPLGLVIAAAIATSIHIGLFGLGLAQEIAECKAHRARRRARSSPGGAS